MAHIEHPVDRDQQPWAPAFGATGEEPGPDGAWRESETWAEVHARGAYGSYLREVRRLARDPPAGWERVLERLAPHLRAGGNEHAGHIELAADGSPEVASVAECAPGAAESVLRALALRRGLIQYHTHPDVEGDDSGTPFPSAADLAGLATVAQRGGCILHAVVSRFGVFLYTPGKLAWDFIFESSDPEGIALMWGYKLFVGMCNSPLEETHQKYKERVHALGVELLHYPTPAFFAIPPQEAFRGIPLALDDRAEKELGLRDAFERARCLQERLDERRRGQPVRRVPPDGYSRQPTGVPLLNGGGAPMGVPLPVGRGALGVPLPVGRGASMGVPGGGTGQAR